MRAVFFAGVIWSTAALAWADCPVKHPALTGLDHASMAAAYTASFKGIYGRNPTFQQGGGVDDGNYWIAVSDHYGEFSDGVCRAGWSAYWEAKLAGTDSAPPALGDQPANFRPDAPAPPVVVPPPASAPSAPLVSLPTCDPAQLNRIEAGVLAIGVDLREHRAAEQSAWASVRHYVALYGKYIGPAVAGVLAGMQAK